MELSLVAGVAAAGGEAEAGEAWDAVDDKELGTRIRRRERTGKENAGVRSEEPSDREKTEAGSRGRSGVYTREDVETETKQCRSSFVLSPPFS